MAPGRSSSRRNTPISPAKPVAIRRTTRATRALRSQSKDIAETDEELQSHETSSVEKSPVSTRTSRRKGKDLSIVEEAQPEIDTAQLPQNEEEDDREDAADSISMGSSFKATAQTTYSQIAIEDLDQDAMIDSLVLLYNAADSLIKVLNVGTESQAISLRNELQIPDSKSFKSFQRRHDAVKFHKEHFGDKNYIELDIAIRGLLNVTSWDLVGEGDWRPDNILELANVAELAYNLLPNSRESRDAKVTLELLQESFPQNFLTDLSESTSELGGSVLVEETSRFALESRIQYAITQLREFEKSGGFDPDEIIRHIFYAEDQLRGFNVPSLRTEDGLLPNEYDEAVASVLMQLRTNFEEDEPFVNFQTLDEEFSWSKFLQLSHRWIQRRANEMMEKIAAQGGAERIQTHLQSEILRRQSPVDNAAAPLAGSAIVDEAKGHTTKPFTVNHPSGPSLKKISASPRDVSRLLKKLGRKSDTVTAGTSGRIPDSSANLTATQGSDDTTNDAALRPPPSAQPEPPSSVYAQALANQMEMQRIQGNKENSDPTVNNQAGGNQLPSKKLTFLDHQAGATRESDISDQSEEDEFDVDRRGVDIGKKRATKPLQPSPRKRARSTPQATAIEDGAIEQDNMDAVRDEEDEGAVRYEKLSSSAPVNEPSVAVSSRRKTTATSGRRIRTSDSPPSRAPNPQPTVRGQTRPRSSQPRATTPIRAGVPSSSAPPPYSTQSSVTSTQSRSEEFSALNLVAKRNRARATMRPVQQRTRWSNVEVDRLVTLVEKHCTKWSTMKKEDEAHEQGPLLEGRDQVALKDKARNIKYDLLCSGSKVLPRNFEWVTLKASQKAWLEDRGMWNGEGDPPDER